MLMSGFELQPPQKKFRKIETKSIVSKFKIIQFVKKIEKNKNEIIQVESVAHMLMSSVNTQISSN